MKNSQEKFRTYEIPTKNILNPRNTKVKKFWADEIPTRENFWPTGLKEFSTLHLDTSKA